MGRTILREEYQDGRVEMEIENKAIDMRISSLPTVYEKNCHQLLDEIILTLVKKI